MTKRAHYQRSTALCLAAFGILLWTSTVSVTYGSFQKRQSATRRNQKSLAITEKSGGLTEEFTFLIKDFKIEHQGETNNLNITIQYRYRVNISGAEYPDFRSVAKDIELFLTNYPNENDYWEILNKKITLLVLDKYPPITKISCQIQVSPSALVPYLRSSVVTRERTPPRVPRDK